jgi:uncharacterized protein YggU (UPF0235/DUF167 family)
MNKADIVVTFASWEERFSLGFPRILDASASKRVIVFYYREYAEQSKSNRESVLTLCEQRRIPVTAIELVAGQPAESWKTLLRTLQTDDIRGHTVLVDITTMPRDIIWTVLWMLDGNAATVDYAYHKPGAYDAEWLSRDPQRPRLVYKLSGELRLGIPTTLIVVTGFDADRVTQLMTFFEPMRTLLGLQTGEQFDNERLNTEKHKKLAVERSDVELFDIDAYAQDLGYSTLEALVRVHTATSNVIMSSLGPKLSAITLYRIHKVYPETAIAYAPSRQFNPNYSRGIAETVSGSL